MKKFLCLFLGLAVCALINDSSAQLMEKIKNKVKQRADQKVDKTVDKGLDEVEEGTKVKKDEDGDTKIKTDDGTKIKTDGDDVKKSSSMSFNSKYDFVPGEKIMGLEDFSKTEIGDFPARWNTNATAEVVTINNKEGKWLKISKQGVFHPEFITSLPDNFTLEFDLAVNPDWKGTHMAVNFANLNKPTDYTDYYHY